MILSYTGTILKLLATIQDGPDAGQTEGLTGLCQRVPWLAVDGLKVKPVRISM